MSTHQPDQLWQLWKQEQIDSTMAIGYMLQNLVLHQEAITKLNTAFAQVRRELDQITQQGESPTSPKLNKKRKDSASNESW